MGIDDFILYHSFSPETSAIFGAFSTYGVPYVEQKWMVFEANKEPKTSKLEVYGIFFRTFSQKGKLAVVYIGRTFLISIKILPFLHVWCYY